MPKRADYTRPRRSVKSATRARSTPRKIRSPKRKGRKSPRTLRRR